METKTCLFCETSIHVRQLVCNRHMPELKEHGKTDWFQELKRMDNRQRYISDKEYLPVLDDVESTAVLSSTTSVEATMIYAKRELLGKSVADIASEHKTSVPNVYKILKQEKERRA